MECKTEPQFQQQLQTKSDNWIKIVNSMQIKYDKVKQQIQTTGSKDSSDHFYGKCDQLLCAKHNGINAKGNHKWYSHSTQRLHWKSALSVSLWICFV